MIKNIRVVTIIMILVLAIAGDLFSKKQQCLGITKKGNQCKRFVEIEPPFCYQHSKDYKKKKKKSLKSTIAKGFYKVHKISDGDTFWVDINKDGEATKDEKVRLHTNQIFIRHNIS